MSKQVGFDRFMADDSSNDSSSDGITFEGPTSRRSDEDWHLLPGSSIDRRELPETGLAPSDFEILNGVCHPDTAAEMGFHPDDRERPNRRSAELENDGFRLALNDQPQTLSEIMHDGDTYDPTDEYDELDEPSEISGFGAGRRKTLAAIDAKDTLDDPQSFGSLQEMTNALREISLAHPDGRTYLGVPEEPIGAIEAAYNDLPEEAQSEYLNDHRLYVKIRAARNRFNDWMGKKRREQEMPSPVEAGPANYPADKARQTAQYARYGREELDEALGKVKSAARGAKQRALEAIGSSIAEHNEAKAQSKAERVKDRLESGDIVFNRSTSYGLVSWGVKRLNKKSVRLKRPHQLAGAEKPMSDGETYPEYDLTTVDYDSDFLYPTDREEWREIDPDEFPEQADVEEELTQGYETAIRYLMGDDWVDDNLDLDEPDETDRPAAVAHIEAHTSRQ